MNGEAIELQSTRNGWVLIEVGYDPVDVTDIGSDDEGAAKEWAAEVLLDRHRRGVYVWEWEFPVEKDRFPGAWVPQMYPEEPAWAR